MFKRVAAEALGLSDIGRVIGPADYDKVDADDYVMHEDGEKIFFLIKSKQDEYCFTNLALIHVDGDSALSKKRMLRRLTYHSCPVTSVLLETAGTIDMDVEIKFRMGSAEYSIDVDKAQIEQVKDLYKALLTISSMQDENDQMLDYAKASLNTAAASIARATAADGAESQFKGVNEYAFNWMRKCHSVYRRKDFAEIYEKFINS